MPRSREIDAAHRKRTGMEGTQELADAQRCIPSPQYATHCRFGSAEFPAWRVAVSPPPSLDSGPTEVTYQGPVTGIADPERVAGKRILRARVCSEDAAWLGGGVVGQVPLCLPSTAPQFPLLLPRWRLVGASYVPLGMATLENTGPFLRSQCTATGATDADASEGAAKIEAGSWMLPKPLKRRPGPPSQDTLSVMVPQSFSITRERTSPYHKERTNERLHMASWGWTRRCFAGALGLATRGSRPDAKNPKILDARSLGPDPSGPGQLSQASQLWPE
ncbi:hypothetical protein BKA56DRAFT_621625 [Ilyonectria sp. MPI-CAGE-AT-0026]|nr:hypothetical protein BKA56DRAFT_621625 [Ilyonectria sp. MPI-CAGE-AT-0026]